MKVTVKSYLTIRKAMQDERAFEIELESTTVNGLLEILCDRYGDELRALLYDQETKKISPHNQICVNTRHYIFLPDRLATRLQDGDVVSLIPPVAGG
jgi:MoaD family protein